MKLNLGCGDVVINRPGWLNVDAVIPASKPDAIVLLYDIHGPLDFAPPGTVDEIVSSHSLEHLERPGEALACWYGLLRPGGTLTVVVPDATHEREWIGIHLATLRERHSSTLEDHHVDFTDATLRALLAAAGSWSKVEKFDSATEWRVPWKAWWQLCLRATK